MAADEIYRFGSYVLYSKRYLLTNRGAPLSLPPRLFDTLLSLLRSAGTVVPKETLIRSVWQGRHVSETNLSRAIADLRKVLLDYPNSIKTISGTGYCFVGSVESISAPQSAQMTESLLPYPSATDLSIRLITVLPFQFAAADTELGVRCAMATATELSMRTSLPVASPAFIGLEHSAADRHKASHLLVAYVHADESTRWCVQVHLSGSEGKIIWATRFVVPQTVADLPVHIARQICRFVECKLRQRGSLSPNVKAIQLHGRALLHWKNRTLSTLATGLKYAEAAIREDGSFAQAHATLANYYCALVHCGYDLPSTLLMKAQEAASRALELDPYLADAHVSLGIIKLRYEFDKAAAVQCFLNAVAIDSKNCTALHWLGNVQCMEGHFTEAAETLREAYELNPKSLSIRNALAQALFLAGDLRLCREWLEEILELNSTFAPAEFGMGMVCGYEGNKKAAMRFLQSASEHSSGGAFYLSSLAYGASKWGSRSTVKTILSHLNFRRRRRYVPHYDLAVTLLANGNQERALEAIELAIKSHDALAPWLGVDPRVRELSGLADFDRLLGEVNSARLPGP